MVFRITPLHDFLAGDRLARVSGHPQGGLQSSGCHCLVPLGQVSAYHYNFCSHRLSLACLFQDSLFLPSYSLLVSLRVLRWLLSLFYSICGWVCATRGTGVVCLLGFKPQSHLTLTVSPSLSRPGSPSVCSIAVSTCSLVWYTNAQIDRGPCFLSSFTHLSGSGFGAILARASSGFS